MSKYLITFYLALVFVILALIQIGIRNDEGPSLVEIESDPKKGFESKAEMVARVTEESRKAELEVRQARIDGEFDEMILIPAGEFIMGSERGPDDQQPIRKIYLDAFYIDKYEVTFAQYYAFVTLTGQPKPRLAGYLSSGVTENLPLFIRPLNPVVGVKWYQAVDYCRWKGKRLPTEAEWEKAARGTEPRIWPWGNDETPENANLVGMEDGFPFTAEVDQFAKDVSPYGIRGMAGNVMEWVSDWFDQDSYRLLPVHNPLGAQHGQQRVIRGASWNDSIKRAEVSVRFKMYPEYRDVTIGFRCAQSS